MSSATLPKKPVENWEQVRDEWVAEVERFMAEVETWAAKQEWGTLRDAKTIEDDGLGPYTVPRLLVYAIFGRFVLDPQARHVVGGTGLIDFFALPSYDYMMLVRHDDNRWYLHVEMGADYERRPWTEEVFVATVHLLKELG